MAPPTLLLLERDVRLARRIRRRGLLGFAVAVALALVPDEAGCTHRGREGRTNGVRADNSDIRLGLLLSLPILQNFALFIC